MLRPLLQNKNYHPIWHKPVQISGRNLCFFIYSSVHTNFGDQIKVVLVLRKVALADSCVGIVITQGSAHATLHSTRTTLDQIIIENYVGYVSGYSFFDMYSGLHNSPPFADFSS